MWRALTSTLPAGDRRSAMVNTPRHGAAAREERRLERQPLVQHVVRRSLRRFDPHGARAAAPATTNERTILFVRPALMRMPCHLAETIESLSSRPETPSTTCPVLPRAWLIPTFDSLLTPPESALNVIVRSRNARRAVDRQAAPIHSTAS